MNFFSNLLQYSVLLSLALGAERTPSSSSSSGEEGLQHPSRSESPPLIKIRAQTKRRYGSKKKYNWAKRAQDAQSEFVRLFQIFQQRMAELEEANKKLESRYALELCKLDGLGEIDKAVTLSQLSGLLNDLNKSRRALAGLKSAKKVHRVVNKNSSEPITDQEIIQGLSAAARESKRVQQQTDLIDWEAEMESHESASLKKARESKEELEQAGRFLAEFYQLYLVQLNVAKSKLEKALKDGNQKLVQDAKYSVEIHESECTEYKTCIDHLAILLKMIDRTNSADEVLTDAQIKTVCDLTGEHFAETDHPTTMYDWQVKIKRLQDQERLKAQEAQSEMERLEKGRLQREQQEAREQELREKERQEKMKIEQEAREKEAREQELRKQDLLEKERREKAKEIREQNEKERVAKVLRSGEQEDRPMAGSIREHEQARQEHERQERVRQEKIKLGEEEDQLKREQNDRRRREESQRRNRY